MLKSSRILSCQKIGKCYKSNVSFSAAQEKGDEHEGQRKTSITAINAITGDRSFVEISRKYKPLKRFRREFNLPQEAIDGLRNSLITCERSSKQLQNEADQLANKLEQRRFPESSEKLKMMRDEIKRKLRSAQKNKETGEDSIDFDEFALGGKIKEAQDYQIRNEVDKILKKSSYNWRPLEITTKEAAASYSLARLASNYAEISRCLEEFCAVPDFVPESVLDFGSGSGAGFWSVLSHWSNSKIKEMTMVDVSDAMTRFSMDTIRKETDDESRPFHHSNVVFRRHLLPSLNTTYDLVIAHRVLCEIGSSETRLQTIESLWNRTNRFLVLVESAQPDAFRGIIEARDFLLTAGTNIEYQKLFEILQEKNEINQNIIDIVESRKLSEYEKYYILRDMIPSDIDIPTQLPRATVLAPCPHDLGCPLGSRSACTFSTRFKPIRADGRVTKKESDGTEVSKFTFVILEKGSREINSHTDRILKTRKLGGHVTCDVCTSFRGIQRITVSKRHDDLYTAVRSRRDGDVLPIKLKTIATEGIFDVSLKE